ncbi:hypothetical protein ACW9HV_31570, partial [Pseudomonas azotoformans]
FALDLDFDLRRPVKHAGRITGTPSLGEVPSVGARALWLLWAGPAFRLFSKVTRRKGGTISRRYPKNGSTPHLKMQLPHHISQSY